MSTIEAPVQLRNVVRQFGQQRVIDGLDLDIFSGEFVALLGTSGSGKTTLLRSLAGLETIDSGQLQVPQARACVPGTAPDAVDACLEERHPRPEGSGR